jgi:hypothetical protein
VTLRVENESWEARVCMRVFSTLMASSNEKKSYTGVDEGWEARICMRVFSTFVFRSNENKSCMGVENREFAWESSQLLCPGLTRTRVAWELRSESLHESFLNFHAPVKREQELHENWLDITAREAKANQNLNQLKVDESASTPLPPQVPLRTPMNQAIASARERA